MNSLFCSPLRYTQGPDATQSLGSELAALGMPGPVLVVTSPSPRKLLEPVWAETLGVAAIAFSIHDFAGECTSAEIARIVESARASGAGTVLGAGGGKVLDAARAAAAQLDLPFICCPTVASTDSPTCAISVVYTADGVYEKTLFHKANPALVLVDSRVIVRAPVRMLVAGMGDALSTVFEARACVAAKKPNTRGGGCTISAMALAELCYRTLLADGAEALRAAKNGDVTPAVERIIEANTLLSGLGFESAGLAGSHGVHNGLTAAPGTHDFLHGEKVAFGVLVQLMLEKADRAQVDEVLGFCCSVGLPVTLGQIGCADLSDELLAEVSARATAPGEWTNNEPFPVTASMVAEAIRSADAAGRAFLTS